MVSRHTKTLNTVFLIVPTSVVNHLRKRSLVLGVPGRDEFRRER
jgi:hypothetical protein